MLTKCLTDAIWSLLPNGFVSVGDGPMMHLEGIFYSEKDFWLHLKTCIYREVFKSVIRQVVPVAPQ